MHIIPVDSNAVDLNTVDLNTVDLNTVDLNLEHVFKALSAVQCYLPPSLRDGREKFIRRFHAFKLAPTLSLGLVDVRRVDRTSRVVDLETKKSSSKQEW